MVVETGMGVDTAKEVTPSTNKLYPEQKNLKNFKKFNESNQIKVKRDTIFWRIQVSPLKIFFLRNFF